MVVKFSIKNLEKLSGIKAHTLRIWEQRYGILKPERTDTNIRWYCNDELKQLLNIVLLYNNGYKISKIASLTNSQLINEVNRISDSSVETPHNISSLIIAMVEIDEKQFEKIISNAIMHLGFRDTIEKVIYPFLHRIGIMWQTGGINPAQEHFISNLIRQKLIVAIDGLVLPEKRDAKKIVMYLPEGELHELSLLYYSYLLKSKGHQIIYLGQSVPAIDLQKVVEIRKPQYIVSVFTHTINDLDAYLKILSKTYPKVKFFLTGIQMENFDKRLPLNITRFKAPADFFKLI